MNVPLEPPPGPGEPPADDPRGVAGEAADTAPTAPVPPAPPVAPVPPVPPPVSEAVLALPTSTRRLVALSLDALTRTDSGLRAASFYVGFLLLLSAGPFLALLVAATVSFGAEAFDPVASVDDSWAGWLVVAGGVGFLGFIAASVESRAVAIAVIGARMEGRPLELRGAVAIARRTFWRVLGAQFLVGIPASLGQLLASAVVAATIGANGEIDFAVTLVAGLLVEMPFVYAASGIVLGEVGVFESLGRSWRLFRARKRLALAVTLFGSLSQFIVLFGLAAGLDVVARVVEGTGAGDGLPTVVALAGALVFTFAIGTLLLLVEAIAAAPQVHAFAALTHYTRGLEVGRTHPLPADRAWRPWLSRPLAAGAVLAGLALVAGLGSLPA